MKKLSYSFFSLITILLFKINQINTQDTISDVYIYGFSNSPIEGQGNQQSSLGGTIFYVKGSGFDSILDNNNVYVGDKKATILGKLKKK